MSSLFADMSVADVIDLYQKKFRDLRKDKANVALAKEVEALDAQLTQSLEIREVMPEDTHILEQLVNEDDVHDFGVGSVDDIVEYRVGGKGSKKSWDTCWSQPGAFNCVIFHGLS